MPLATLTKPPFKREIELNFIRGIAILMVLDFHSQFGILFYPFQLLGFRHFFGWSGVDLFFVLSGFLVGGLLVKEWKVRGKIDSKQFLIRRGFKIWPQYYVYLVVILITRHRTIPQLWGNLLNIQNYVGGTPHTWSLAVEEHAYLFIVFCLAIAAWQGATMRHLFIFFSLVILWVVATRPLLISLGYNGFVATHTRIDGILYGVLLAILYHYKPDLFRRLQSLWGIWVAVLALALIYFRVDPFFPWMNMLQFDIANWMGIALLMLLYKHQEGKQRSLAYRFIAWIGLYSYGIYLWHVSVADPIIRAASHLPAWLSFGWRATAPLVFGVAIGVLFTKLVEVPALLLRERLFPRRVDSAVGIPAQFEDPITVTSIPSWNRG